MKKTAFFIFLVLNSLFALYQFNISVRPLDNISVKEDYETSEPNMMFYSNGSLYFTDPGVPAVFEYGEEEESLSKVTSTISSPISLYVAEDNKMYVTDSGAGLVRRSPYKVIYDQSTPHGVWMHNGSFYLADYSWDRILVLKGDGMYSGAFGRAGTYSGNFNRPEDLQIFNNSIYVSDSGNGRVERFSLNFTYARTYGSGKEGVVLQKPNGIFVDGNYVYIADTDGNKIAIYTDDGYPVYVYGLEGPRDIVVAGKKLYVSQGFAGEIFVANISLPQPSSYAKSVFESLSPDFADYSSNSEVGQALGIQHNATPAAEWRNAEFSLELGNYGEAFYKSMALNSTNVSRLNKDLEANLTAKITQLAQNSTAKGQILSLLQDGNYTGAYAELISSPQAKPNITANITNVTANQTNFTLDTSGLMQRLGSARSMVSQYHMSADLSQIESMVARAEANQTAFDSAKLMLDSLEQKINLQAYKVGSARGKINALQNETAKNELFVDYSSALQYYNNAASILYSDPEMAAQLAEQGMLEIQKAKQGVGFYYLAILAAIAVVIALIFFIKDYLMPSQHRFRRD